MKSESYTTSIDGSSRLRGSDNRTCIKARAGQGLRPTTPAGLIALLFLFAVPALAQDVTFGSCYAHWTDRELIVGNAHVERKWSIEGALIRATSFYDRDSHTEWLSKPASQPLKPSGKNTLTIAAHGGRFSPVESPSLEIDIFNGASLLYRMQVFAEARGVEIDLQPGRPVAAVSMISALPDPPAPSIAEQETFEPSEKLKLTDSPDELSLAPQHLRFTQVTLTAETDQHNQLVSTRDWMFMNNEKDLILRGDLFFIEDVVSGSGLIFLKQAPLPEARAVQSDFDLRVIASSRTFLFSSQGYPSVVLAYSGGRSGRIQALQTYQRQLRQYLPGRDGLLLTNTWGDRNRDSRNNAAFVEREIAAGARLGADVIQIDDGWQAGRSTNSARGPGIPNGFWSTQAPFWAVDSQRYPLGLAPLVRDCTSRDMKMGLWYAPDSSQEFANWQRDAGQILDLYRHQGISYFKFDSIDIRSAQAEDNLNRLFQRILVESNGAVTIDLDVTGTGRRPGYFGVMNSGPIFVENRYSDFHRYWPHLTLRNLWQLSEYVDPLRLRMEFLNNTRNRDRYDNDPLAPGNYGADSIFATVMFSSPLGWFENSSLPEDFYVSAAPLIAAWKRERENLYNGTILPIGDPPDGVSWTGFASIAKASASARPGLEGYMLVFRELNDQPDWSVEIPLNGQAPARVTVLAGQGTATTAGGRLIVHIPEKLQYLWVRLDACKPCK